MKILYTGIGSRVGKALEKFGVALLDCDVQQRPVIEVAIATQKPDMIIHLAGKSDVNWCEENRTQASAINFRGAVNVFRSTYDLDIPVIAISSDHIFDGRHGNYKEDTKDKFKNPVNHYGMTKLAMEAAAISFPNVRIVRTSLLFDFQRELVQQYLVPLQKGEKIWAPGFITRSFMYVPHFAEALYAYAQRFYDMPKFLHISGNMTVSWYFFVSYMASVYRYNHDLVSERNIYNSDKTFGAPRPLRGGLAVKKAVGLGFECPNYMEGLRQMKEDESLKVLGYD